MTRRSGGHPAGAAAGQRQAADDRTAQNRRDGTDEPVAGAGAPLEVPNSAQLVVLAYESGLVTLRTF